MQKQQIIPRVLFIILLLGSMLPLAQAAAPPQLTTDLLAASVAARESFELGVFITSSTEFSLWIDLIDRESRQEHALVRNYITERNPATSVRPYFNLYSLPTTGLSGAYFLRVLVQNADGSAERLLAVTVRGERSGIFVGDVPPVEAHFEPLPDIDESPREEQGPPVMEQIGDKVIFEGQLLRVTFAVSDPQDDPITVFGLLPPGVTEDLEQLAVKQSRGSATFYLQASYTFVEAPASERSFPVRIIAWDGTNVAEQVFTITVLDSFPEEYVPPEQDEEIPEPDEDITDDFPEEYVPEDESPPETSVTTTRTVLPPVFWALPVNTTTIVEITEEIITEEIITAIGIPEPEDQEENDEEEEEDEEEGDDEDTEGDENHPPIITSTPLTTAREDELYTYQVIAEDPDNDPLTYHLVTAPRGMAMTASGLIRWTPPREGAELVRIQVSDGQLSAFQTYTITVTKVAEKLAIISARLLPDEFVRVGSEIVVTVTVENRGMEALEDVRLRAFIPDIGVISGSAQIDRLLPGERAQQHLSLWLPASVHPGVFMVKITAESQDAREAVYRQMTIQE
ncbi:MAG: Ig domain-containing protein [Nanoarchaeota archaeon]|nr:Ig domain-containing protein [Nanoarchaeota archaeon]